MKTLAKCWLTTSSAVLAKTFSLAVVAAVVLPFDAAKAVSSTRPQVLNISTRLQVQTGDNVLIAGFIITGNSPKKVIIRGLGPSLTRFGLSGVLADPLLELHKPGGSVVANDNWRSTQQVEIQATGIPPENNFESAIVATLTPGAYTAILRGVNNGVGVGLVEVYDLDPAVNSKLANVSTRGFVQTGDNVMIAGVITGGKQSMPLVMRAIGPSLSQAGVHGVLLDPMLELHDANGTLVGFNDNWKATQQADLQASGLPPENDAESAIMTSLAAGAYTAIVRGKNNQAGVALVEAYQVDFPAYDHIFVIVMENVGYENVIGSANAPYINKTLLPQGALYINSYGLIHPSLPNYLALFCGSTLGVKNNHCINDSNPNGPFNTPNLYSELKKIGKTALGYMDSLPHDGYSGCRHANLYVQKHNPFMYFNAGTANRVPYSATVVYRGPYSANTTWPNLTFISPNLINDMHSGGPLPIRVSNGDTWLSKHLPPLITYAKNNNGLIILTMDEGPTQHIPTILVGARVRGGQRISQNITHYNVIKTITDNFGVAALGESVGLAPLKPAP